MSDINRSYKVFYGEEREEAIKRDGQKCVKCMITRDEHKEKYNRDITVDHIDGKGRNTPLKLKNNSLNNLQTLCLSCHGKKDILRRTALNTATGERHGSAKLKQQDVDDIRMFYSRGIKVKDIVTVYPVSKITLYYIVNGTTWKTNNKGDE